MPNVSFKEAFLFWLKLGFMSFGESVGANRLAASLRVRLYPSFSFYSTLSVLYVLYGSTPLLAAVFAGIKHSVVAIVFLALLKISAKVLKTKTDYAVAVVSLLCLLFFNINMILWIFISALFGAVKMFF